YHVAGLAVKARCEVSGSAFKVYSQKKWDPSKFIDELEDCHYTSLVPTQLYDLVKTYHRPPPTLKGVLIGGDKMSKTLFDQAIERGWPIYRSYGMTETAASVALSDLNKWDLKTLSHNEIKIDRTIKIKGPTLLTAYFDNHFYDPKSEGWFDTGDEGVSKSDSFDVKGRLNQFKVGGELFSLSELQEKLDHFNTLNVEAVLVVKECERMGSKVVLYHNHPHVEKMIDPFNGIIHPLVRIKEHIFLDQLPRNIIGKVVVN
ncbi:MAG: AMP-binding protein, partial [Parachlamydiaceae bacterium]